MTIFSSVQQNKQTDEHTKSWLGTLKDNFNSFEHKIPFNLFCYLGSYSLFIVFESFDFAHDNIVQFWSIMGKADGYGSTHYIIS